MEMNIESRLVGKHLTSNVEVEYGIWPGEESLGVGRVNSGRSWVSGFRDPGCKMQDRGCEGPHGGPLPRSIVRGSLSSKILEVQGHKCEMVRVLWIFSMNYLP